MAEEREIVTIDVDTRAYLDKLAELETRIREFRAEAEGGAGLDDAASADRLREGIRQVTPHLERMNASKVEAIKSSRDLANIVRMLGGHFASYITYLTSVYRIIRNATVATKLLAGAFGAVSLVISGAIALWKRKTEAIREHNQRMEQAAKLARDMAGERLGERERAADVLARAGVTGVAEAVSQRAQQISRERGIDEDTAMFGAVAAQIGGLNEEMMTRVMRGFLVTGREERFVGRRAEDIDLIRRMIAAGSTREAETFFEGRIADVGEIVKARTAAPMQRADEQRFADEYALWSQRIARERGLNEEDTRKLWRLRNEPLGNQALSNPDLVRKLFEENWSDISTDYLKYIMSGHAFRAIQSETLKGGTQSLLNLVTMAREAQLEIDAKLLRPVNVVHAGVVNVTPPSNRARQNTGTISLSEHMRNQHR